MSGGRRGQQKRGPQMLALTVIHILFGTISIVAGASAMVLKKGAKLHRLSGRVFAVSLVLSSVAGCCLALIVDDQFLAFLAGVLTVYLVGSGVLAAAGRAGQRSHLAMFAIASTLTGAMFWLAWEASRAEAGTMLGYGPGPYIFLGAICLIATLGDVRTLIARTLGPADRLSRHLWRMSFGFFIAAGSLFTGPGASAFPQSVRESGVLSLPEPLILLLMIFWLIRVRWRSAPRTAPSI
ncbi:hypothetical protein [Hyphomonas neptunium]|nr:hypothetical protein [Hyphomonas neptunium]